MDLQSLQQRPEVSRLSMLYKLHYNQAQIQIPDYFMGQGISTMEKRSMKGNTILSSQGQIPTSTVFTPDHQALEPVATLNNKCTYCKDLQHFIPASYHQPSNWAQLCSQFLQLLEHYSTCPAPARFYLHQSWFVKLFLSWIFFCRRGLVVGVYSSLLVLHSMWRCTTGVIPNLVYRYRCRWEMIAYCTRREIQKTTFWNFKKILISENLAAYMEDEVQPW